MTAWLSQHRAAFLLAASRLLETPLGTLLSLIVISVALTLPAFGYLMLESLLSLRNNINNVQQISVFMNVSTKKEELEATRKRLTALQVPWHFVSRVEALERLQKTVGMAEIIASLPDNPLPDAFVIEPRRTDPESLAILEKELAGWPQVAHVQVDFLWAKRFDAFLRLGKLVFRLLAGLFAVGLVAVTFNTIRLQVTARAAEIDVARMIGATDAFIHRPFYYFGALQGFLGATLCILMLTIIMRFLSAPIAELTMLYGGSFSLHALSLPDTLSLLSIGSFLGVLGANLSVRLLLTRSI